MRDAFRAISVRDHAYNVAPGRYFLTEPSQDQLRNITQRADGAAQKGNKNGSGEPGLSHVMLHGEELKLNGGSYGPPIHPRPAGRDFGATQSWFERSKRMPRSSSSRSMRRRLELAIASIILFQ